MSATTTQTPTRGAAARIGIELPQEQLDALLTAGPYKLQRVLGRGTSKLTISAIDQRTGTPVAVGVLQPEREHELERLGGYMVVMELQRRTGGHPGVMRVLDVEVTAGTPHVVMEHLSGWALSDFIDLGRRPSLAGVLRVADQVSGALDYLHRGGLAYMGMALDHVMIANDGRLALVDFDRTRIAGDEDREGGSVGLVSARPGRASYAAPERFTSPLALPESDVYGLGALLYQLLAGQAPGLTTLTSRYAPHWQGSFDAERIHQQYPLWHVDLSLTTGPEPLREHGVSAPPRLESLIGSMLSKAPGDRPTAAEVQEEARRIADDLGIDLAPSAPPAAPAPPPLPPSTRPAPTPADTRRIETRKGKRANRQRRGSRVRA